MAQDNKQIERWVAEGIISPEQATKMLSQEQEKASGKIVTTISTIGAILLGIGAILLVASNWQDIPAMAKTLLLIGSTAGAYIAGYMLKYKKDFPKVGSALLFLGALLFGATVFLLAQIYNVDANNSTLVMIWLIGILPLVYALRSVPIAQLAILLFYVWLTMQLFQDFDLFRGSVILMPIIYLATGLLIFVIGGYHYIGGKFSVLARSYRLAGIQVVMFMLFLLSFSAISAPSDYSYGYYNDAITNAHASMTSVFITLAIFTILGACGAIFFNPAKSDTSKLENSIAIGLAAIMLVFFYSPSETFIYPLLFNLILAYLIFVMFQIGYRRHDMRLVNIGMGFTCILIAARYFDFAWDLMPRSLFFIIGGAILLMGGIALEKKRKQIKMQFNTPA